MSQETSARTTKLIKDIGIYAVGNLGSKLVTFMLVPLYTHYIQPAAFGYYDICLTAIFVLMPFLSFQLRDGAFRFLIDADTDKKRREIVSFVYKTLSRNTLITIILTTIAYYAFSIEYIWYIVWLLIAMSIYEVIIQVIRGLGYTKSFVGAGICTSFLIGFFSVIFVVWLGMQIEGIFLANILARLLTIAIIELRLKIMLKYFRYRFNDPEVNRSIIKYSLPLLPGAVCWWLVGSSNKFFIEHYLGLADNGQYAVALKFTSILETIAMIFYQAWQETALRQYHSSDKNVFFTTIFNNYFYVISILVVFFPFIIRFNYSWLVSPEYYESAQYLYLLSISAMAFSLSAFFDMGYQCSKSTLRSLNGIALASTVNIIATYLLIQEYQIYGVILGSILTFVILFFYRYIDTKEYFLVKFNIRSFVATSVVITSTIIFYLFESITVQIIYLLLVLIVLIIFIPTNIKEKLYSKARAIKNRH